jgi:hypothetical protein
VNRDDPLPANNAICDDASVVSADVNGSEGADLQG